MPTHATYTGITNAEQLLTQVQGEQLLGLLRRLGFWVAGPGGPAAGETRPFPRDLAGLDDVTLGNTAGYWQSELSRVTALIGALAAQKMYADAHVKRTSAAQSRTILRGYSEREEKAPTAARLAAEVDGRPEVQAAQDEALLVGSTIKALESLRESFEGYTRAISREISRRDALARSGIR